MTSLWELKLYTIAMFLVVVGGLNWGSVGIFGKNLVEELNGLTINNEWFVKIIYILVALAALYLVFKKNSFFPFLGNTFVPVNNMTYNHIDGNMSVRVNAENAKGVIYWAAEPNSETYSNPQEAYSDYLNSGYVKPDSDGKATLFFNCPGNYKVMGWRKLPKHVHYRLVYSYDKNGGINISDVKTVNVNCTDSK